MTRILGQPPVPLPPPGFGSWEQYKAYWFQVYDYKIQTQEVANFHKSTAAVRIVSAPARSGKSYAAAMDTFPFAMPSKPLCSTLHWIVGPTYDTNKEFEYLWDVLVEKKDRHGFQIEAARNNPKNGDMLIRMVLGRDEEGRTCRSIIEGKSATNERALQGEEVTTATLSEAAEHPSTIFTKYLETRCWKINLPTTPKPNAEWIREMVELSERDNTLGIEAFTFPPGSNPVYNFERFREAERKAALRSPTGRAEDDPYFAEQFLGRWGYYTGLVLPFSTHRHIIEQDELDLSSCRVFLSVDYGYDDPFVALFWAVEPSGRYVIFDEIYQRRLDTQTACEMVADRLAPHRARLDYVVGDPSRPEVAQIFRNRGLKVWDRNKNAMRDRAAGHHMLTDLLTEGPVPGEPGLVLTRNVKSTAHEWLNLRYREGHRNEYGTTAIEGDDHAYDAARYAVMTRARPRNEVAAVDWSRERMRRARARQTPRWANPLVASRTTRWGAM